LLGGVLFGDGGQVLRVVVQMYVPMSSGVRCHFLEHGIELIDLDLLNYKPSSLAISIACFETVAHHTIGREAQGCCVLLLMLYNTHVSECVSQEFVQFDWR
jgi:hypothetical protein